MNRRFLVLCFVYYRQKFQVKENAADPKTDGGK